MWLKITGFLFYLFFIFVAIALGILTCVYSFKAYSALKPEAASYDTLKHNLNFARIFSLAIVITMFVCMLLFIIGTLMYYVLNSSSVNGATTEAETGSGSRVFLFISLLCGFVSLIGITFLTVTFIAINVLLQLATALPNAGITSTRNNGSWIILYSSLAFLSTLIAAAGLIVFVSSSVNKGGASDEEIKINKLNEKMDKTNKALIMVNENVLNSDINSKSRYNRLSNDIQYNKYLLNIIGVSNVKDYEDKLNKTTLSYQTSASNPKMFATEEERRPEEYLEMKKGEVLEFDPETDIKKLTIDLY